MKVSNWSSWVQDNVVVVESPNGCTSKFLETDTHYSISVWDNGYYVTTKPSYITCFFPMAADTNTLQNISALRNALNQYFINEDVEIPIHIQEKPKKYMRLPNSGTLVYLVDILSACRLTHGGHNGTSLFIQYPIGSIHISCGTIENAIADERTLAEYLLSLQ